MAQLLTMTFFLGVLATAAMLFYTMLRDHHDAIWTALLGGRVRSARVISSPLRLRAARKSIRLLPRSPLRAAA